MRNERLPSLDYEAEYNNRARVPEHMAIIGQWGRDASAARDELGGPRDLAYGDAPRNVLDGFTPTDPINGAVVMFIHGGYWQALDKSSFSHMARGPVAHGVSVYIPSYTLCPDVQISDIIAEMRTAAMAVHRLTGRLVVVAGHSAGGHLAAALLATDWPAISDDLPADLVTSAYSISGVFELAPLVHTSINGALGLDAASAAAVSPALWAAPTGKTCDAVVGGAESSEFHRQSADLAHSWGAAGVATRYESVPHANHFDVIAPMADPDSAMTARLVQLTKL